MKRYQQREQAFVLLFEHAFLPDEDLITIYDENIEPVSAYAKQLFSGVVEKMDKLDETISTYSKGWKIHRLPKVTLTVLRIAVYEMQFVEEVPVSIAINEAVELAKKFGTAEDAAFVNGILGAVARSAE